MGHSIVILGVGPRGTYALDFLTRALRVYALDEPVEVHLVEPQEFGAGAVYRTDQPEYLLMNTIASQLTAFADAPIGPDDPFAPGPSMLEWLQGEGVTCDPNEYPSRAAHGRYLNHAFKSFCARHLPRVTLHFWNCRAVDIESFAGQHCVVLDGGHPPILADVVLLNTGHSAHAAPLHDTLGAFVAEQHARGNDRVRFLPSIYPVQERLDAIEPGARVGILGLGLTAIDGIIALTEGRGGRFERQADASLVYRPSGREPRIASWSLPGLPPSARAYNQKGATFRHAARFLTRSRIDALRAHALLRTGTHQLDFQRDVFPLLLLEMEHAYYAALRGADFASRFAAVAESPAAREALLAEIAPRTRFSWAHLEDPARGWSFASREDYVDFLRSFLRDELAEASRGNLDGPYKAATDVLRDLRGNIRYVVEHAGLTPDSHREFDRHFWPLHNRIAAGPPAIRIEQLLALVEAGTLDLSHGPAPRLVPSPERGCFLLVPQAFEAEACELDVVIDGRIPVPHVLTDRSVLLQNLLARGAVRPFVNGASDASYTPCGIEITEDHRVVGADGAASESLFAMGILCEGTQLYTFVAAAPGVAARPLLEARAWALRVVEFLRGREEGAPAAQSGRHSEVLVKVAPLVSNTG